MAGISLSQGEKSALVDLRDELKNRFRHVHMIVVGKRGFAESPEIDLLVLLHQRDEKIETEIHKLCHEIELKNNLQLSAIVHSAEELKNASLNFRPFYRNMAVEGVAV